MYRTFYQLLLRGFLIYQQQHQYVYFIQWGPQLTYTSYLNDNEHTLETISFLKVKESYLEPLLRNQAHQY